MMKLYFLVLPFFLNIVFVYSQVTQEWVARYNGSYNGFDKGKTLIVDEAGNVYVAGESENGFENSDLALIKYNSSGKQQWVFLYRVENEKNNTANGISIDKDGYIYIAGASYNSVSNFDLITIKLDANGNELWHRKYDDNLSFDFFNFIETDNLNDVIISGESNGDIILLKYKSNGDLQWVKKYNGTYNGLENLSSMKLDLNGNVYLSGTSEMAADNYDALLLKYNNDGSLVWSKTYHSSSNYDEYFYSVTVDSACNAYVTGEIMLSFFMSDCVTIKYDSTGFQHWYKIFNGPENDIDLATDIAIDQYGNVFVAGQSLGENTFNNYLLIKYDSNGEQQWYKIFDGGENDIVSAMVTDNIGNVYLTGSSWGIGVIDYLTVKYSSMGILHWQMSYNGPGNHQDAPTSIVLDEYSNVIVTGYSRGSNNLHDIATIKYSQPIGIIPVSSQTPSQFSLSQNYPNPFNPATKIKFQIPLLRGVDAEGGRGVFVQISVHDILSREVKVLVNEKLAPGTYEVDWDESAFPSGIYFYTITSGEYSETRKMVLLK